MQTAYPESQRRLLDHLTPYGSTNVTECMRRAYLCNKLAKLVRGHLRHRLYRMKDSNILKARELGILQLRITVDHDLHHGLLSIGLRDDPAIRVHTHENWLDLCN